MSAARGRRPPGAEQERREPFERRAPHAAADSEQVARGGERLAPHELEELRRAWRCYCEVIAELEQPGEEAAPPR